MLILEFDVLFFLKTGRFNNRGPILLQADGSWFSVIPDQIHMEICQIFCKRCSCFYEIISLRQIAQWRGHGLPSSLLLFFPSPDSGTAHLCARPIDLCTPSIVFMSVVPSDCSSIQEWDSRLQVTLRQFRTKLIWPYVWEVERSGKPVGRGF